MNQKANGTEAEILLGQQRRSRRHKMLAFLACIVVFCTTYALILPAITLDHGAISPGDTATIGVGDTVTLNGSNGNQNNWSASPEGCVTIASNGNSATVTGAAAGTVTITHQYKRNKSDTFTIIVAAADDENTVLTTEDVSGYTVSVKGNKNILTDGVTLHVEDYSSSENDYDDYFNALADDSREEGGNEGGEGGNEGTETDTGTDQSVLITNSGLLHGSKNAWQIVAGKYEGNTGANKAASSDGNVRVQKNIIPTDVENEFLVYLSIDTKQLFANYFASAEYQATTSNNNHDSVLGAVVDSMTGNEKVGVSGSPASGYSNSANFTFLSSSGEILAENITLYWSQANNVTFYLVVNDGSRKRYILTGLSIKKGKNETVMLSEEAEHLIMSNAAQMANLNQVSDVMGDYIEYLGVVAGNYNSEPIYDASSKTLTWVPAVKSNPTIDKVKTDEQKTISYTDSNGKVKTITTYKYTSYALNTAELVYRVRLDVTKKGFNSAAANMDSTVYEAESYAVNQSAALTYDGSKTVDFQQPYVRGLLYDLAFDKTDKDTGEKLTGAEFTLTSSEKDQYPVAASEHGAYRADNLPWGTYTLTETRAPNGYQISTDTDPPKVTLCYTTDRDKVAQSASNSANMAYTGGNTAAPLQVTNEKIKSVYADLIKTDMSYEPLSGAAFSIYDTDPAAEGAMPMEGYENITVGEGGIIADNIELETGKTYYLVESKAPDGYKLPKSTITLTIDAANTTAPISASGGDGRTEISSETQTIDNTDTTVYVIKIPNNPGVKLPSTGGSGTLLYTFGGFGLILISCLMYGYSLRRRRERRSL